MGEPLAGVRDEPRDPMHFAFPEELQEPAEPEPPFWPKLLLVGALIFGLLAAGALWRLVD